MNADELRRAVGDTDKAIERAIDRWMNAPSFSRDALGDVIGRVDGQRAADREADRQAAWDRMRPVWESSAAELDLRGRVDDATRRLRELLLSEADQEAWGEHLERLAGRALDESVVRDLEAEVEGAIEDARRRST